jgi:uncharacterized protein
MIEKSSPSAYFPLQAALFEASLVALAILLGWILNQPPFATLRLNPQSIGLGLIAVLPLLALLLACERVSWQPIRDVRRVLDDMIVPMFRDCHWIDLLAISLIAGVGEEVLFRGVLQAALVEWTGDVLPHSPAWAVVGDWIGLVAVAILFGMAHALNFGYALLAALIGLYLGWLWLATDNLTVPIVAHAVYDFVALMYFLRRK